MLLVSARLLDIAWDGIHDSTYEFPILLHHTSGRTLIAYFPLVELLNNSKVLAEDIRHPSRR